MHSETVFQLDDCSISLSGKAILAPQSFSIQRGDFTVVSGRSGAGKSTLLQLLLGFLQPTAGRALFNGADLTVVDVKALRREIAVVFQEPVLLGETVAEALFEPFGYKANSAGKPDEDRVLSWFERFDLKIGLEAKIAGISGGEKQRVALIRALLLERDILVLDEVTSALDEVHRRLVFDVLSESNLTVIAVSHDNEWVERAPVNIRLVAPDQGGEM